MPVAPALRRLRQENHKLEASLGYTVRPGKREKEKPQQERLSQIEELLLYTLSLSLCCLCLATRSSSLWTQLSCLFHPKVPNLRGPGWGSGAEHSAGMRKTQV
jgi:hypothetical protein